MSFYDKRIWYLDLWEEEEKIGNAGFVKIDVRDNDCRVWISMKGIFPSDVLVGQLFLLTGEEELLADPILFHQGMGTYAAKWDASNLAHVGITYSEWTGIRVKISAKVRVEKMWGSREALKELGNVHTGNLEDSLIEERAPRETALEETKRVTSAHMTKAETQDGMRPEEGKDRIPVSKWSMLGHYYKKKKPFGDEKEYLCISPEDLILLPEKYEHLYKNSFLLHGYYAYGHILLGAVDVQNRNIYRLYIPGMGHDKEQIVAGMFGFGNFMPAKQVRPDEFLHEKNMGTREQYGYYYMTVEL